MNKLRILLGNNTLSLLAGSETWTYTLAVQLKKMGHVVHCFAPSLGTVSQMLEKQGIPCFDHINMGGAAPFSIVLEEVVDYKYDVIISNHNHVVDFLRSMFPKTPIISTIHGIIHSDGEGNKAPEHPALSAGVGQFVAVSEEVQKLLKDSYQIDSVIIRNFFDLKEFKMRSRVSKGSKPKQILFNSNYATRDDPSVQVLREVAKHYGAKLAAIGQEFSQSFDVKIALKDADVVFGMGRSVLEGVAAGRLGIVHGRWGTGGPITAGTVAELQDCNFSGRNSNGRLATKEEIIEMIDKLYDETNVKWGLLYMAQQHNVVMAAEAYLRIARELLGLNIVRPSAIRPYRRQKDVQPTA